MRRTGFIALVVLIAAAAFSIGTLVRLPTNVVWAPVIAALGAAFLTAAATTGVEFVRGWQENKEQRRTERRTAYVSLLTASLGAIHLATTAHELRKLGTGLVPKVRIADPVRFLESFGKDYLPLFDAWSLVWVHGSEDAIAAANRLVDALNPAMSLATARGEARPSVLGMVAGEKWTDQQEQELGKSLAMVGRARLDFAGIARRELGADDANLLAGINEGSPASKP